MSKPGEAAPGISTEQQNLWGKDNKREKCWRGFAPGVWQKDVDVRDFIVLNYTPYEGDSKFLAGPAENTKKLWLELSELLKKERERGGVLDADTEVIASATSHKAGYINSQLEEIVGLQTDAPLKRAIMPAGGVRMVDSGLEAYGFKMSPKVDEIYTKYRKSHNQGVFDAYTPAMRAARKSGIVTGLPDAYGRGRIIGDYRRVALYGVDRLIEDKLAQQATYDNVPMTEDVIRAREEISDQIAALKDLKTMASFYGYDISGPASDVKEAIQWTYFAYLGAVKEQNGAAMSLGRVSTFFDVFAERDLKAGKYTEEQIQAFIDHFVIKLRIVRFLRTPEYDALFSGDPTWVTECIGGMTLDGRPMVTKSSYRFMQTLYNLGPAPEPNITVLWSQKLPENFKKFCAKVSIDTSSIQYENDDLMRGYWGDDYGIACCVSAMRIGKQMQFFGARVNMAKTLLYAINGGRDEMSGEQIGPAAEPITSEYLDYDEVMRKFEPMMDWLAKTYVNTLNVIHYMHDKYAYERMMFAFHDRDIFRTMACGMAGLSVVSDALSAIKYAKVRVIRDETGLATDFEIEGQPPRYGNNDERVDSIARWLVEHFMDKIRQYPCYRGATPTQSILTITSNVVYGKKTGSTPDGRKKGEPFAPGANPMHGRDEKGAMASMMSVAGLDYKHSQDGISYTFSVVPKALGRTEDERSTNLAGMLDGYFGPNQHTPGGHHINVNVLDREMLLDAMEHPENYPQLTIRVSGYAVNFIKLTKEQQMDVINRTFHGRM
ncbi:MAG: formate C-acetyltransferase [Alphaproteobacteria bacterium]|nr:formate C-acetyltransferase [Alphaproteobacteria bacterium]